MDQVKFWLEYDCGRNFLIFSDLRRSLKCVQSVSRCSIVSGSKLQKVHRVFGKGVILVLKVLRLECPVMISTRSLRSDLFSLRICLLYFGSILGKKIFVCLYLLGSCCHRVIQSA